MNTVGFVWLASYRNRLLCISDMTCSYSDVNLKCPKYICLAVLVQGKPVYKGNSTLLLCVTLVCDSFVNGNGNWL